MRWPMRVISCHLVGLSQSRVIVGVFRGSSYICVPVDCPLGVTKVMAFYFRNDLLLAQPPTFPCSCSCSYFLPFLHPTSSQNAAGGVPRAVPDAASGGGAEGWVATIETPGGRPRLSRAPAGTPRSPKSHREVCGWKKRESERRCSEWRLDGCW